MVLNIFSSESNGEGFSNAIATDDIIYSSDSSNLYIGIKDTDHHIQISETGLTIPTSIQTPMLCGMVAYFALPSAPTGWLKANGAAISRTAYANLYAKIGTTFGVGDGSTTFTLPDLRGEFIRGWDDGKNVDTSRSFGSAQGAAMENHTHSGTTNTTGNHTHACDIRTAYSFNNAFGGHNGNPVSGTAYTKAAGNHSHTVTTGNPNTGGGTETRPRNIAMLACIKY